MQSFVTAVVVMLVGSLQLAAPMPLSKSQHTVLVLSDNVKYLASFIDSSAIFSDKYIYFGSGTANEKLLEVPLGEINPEATIRITVGLQAPVGRADHDPTVGISDGQNRNVFIMWDTNNYGTYAPCYPNSGTHTDNRVSASEPYPMQFTMVFTPYRKHGACYTGQKGGYVNIARFNAQLHTTDDMSLVVYRHGRNERYRFYYFLIEILE